VIVADTGALVALVDADNRFHEAVRALFEEDPDAWVLPWAVLPETDYLLENHVGAEAARAFRADLADGLFAVEWGEQRDLLRAHELCERYRDLALGLVDAAVMAVAERLGADAIATLDLRDFAPVALEGRPRLLPRDA
jgi:hypothetical protein